MVRAVEKVRQRLLRAAAALEAAGVPYAIIGGNAVAAWLARVADTPGDTTGGVDLLLRRGDLAAATSALSQAGFVPGEVGGRTVFLDGPAAGARDAVHVIFAAEKVQADYLLAAPDVAESEPGDGFRILSLDALVRMKLTSFRDKDRVHLRDLIDVGLVDPSWRGGLPQALADRLQEIIDNPDG
jgi:hypothetical protein